MNVPQAVISGVGATPVTRDLERPLPDLCAATVKAALEDAEAGAAAALKKKALRAEKAEAELGPLGAAHEAAKGELATAETARAVAEEATAKTKTAATATSHGIAKDLASRLRHLGGSARSCPYSAGPALRPGADEIQDPPGQAMGQAGFGGGMGDGEGSF